MKKAKNARKACTLYRYIATRVIVFGLAVWLLFCGMFTWVAINKYIHNVQEDTYHLSFHIAKDRGNCGSELSLIDFTKLFPFMRSNRTSGYVHSMDGMTTSSDDFDVSYEEIAYIIEGDDTGKITSRPHLLYNYVTSENWHSDPVISGRAVTYVDASYPEVLTTAITTHTRKGLVPYGAWNIPLLRMTGYFGTHSDSNQFYPVSIDAVPDSEDDYFGAKYADLSQADARGELTWENIADFPLSTDGKELQTIYVWQGESYNFLYEPFSVSGKTFTDLVELIEQHGYEVYYNFFQTGTIFETVVMSQAQYNNHRCTVAIRCWPLQYVLLYGWHIYLGSFVLMLLAVFICLRRIRIRIALPLEELVAHHKLVNLFTASKFLPEFHMLNDYLQERNQQLAQANAEIQRLSKALDYAQDAEENRRQLVSNLTHELKTPLAVIHSYAEGLQEGIARDKQDRYLSVITEESERMDAMVLEMLDLSRLEAGRVRLAADQFSLLAVARSVTDKFSPMLEARELTLQYEQEDDRIITADEGRITQAITNLVSNAFKYAPTGSTVRVRVGLFSDSSRFYLKSSDRADSLCFSIENDAKPLSEEALQKVWDSFYRTDSSRTAPGTGLGLAIVKSIVELHRGKCFARNTLRPTDPSDGRQQTGVEFGFSLPMQ